MTEDALVLAAARAVRGQPAEPAPVDCERVAADLNRVLDGPGPDDARARSVRAVLDRARAGPGLGAGRVARSATRRDLPRGRLREPAGGGLASFLPRAFPGPALCLRLAVSLPPPPPSGPGPGTACACRAAVRRLRHALRTDGLIACPSSGGASAGKLTVRRLAAAAPAAVFRAAVMAAWCAGHGGVAACRRQVRGMSGDAARLHALAASTALPASIRARARWWTAVPDHLRFGPPDRQPKH